MKTTSTNFKTFLARGGIKTRKTAGKKLVLKNNTFAFLVEKKTEMELKGIRDVYFKTA